MSLKTLIGGAPVSRWLDLAVPRFKCGHEKTPANSYRAGEFPRCKTCHQAKRKVAAA